MTVRILHGDCLDLLGVLDADSIDSCVTDPPYHLTSIVKRFGAENAAPATSNGETGVYARASRGFMGKVWDGGDIAMRPDTWSRVLRVLKPGAHLIALCGTRTEHRIATAIEDAGFEIRDRILWLYGQGFPKSHNLDGEHEGWGTALKPAMEIGVLARKPLIGTVAENVAKYGTGALNIDACRYGPGVRVTTGNGKRERTDGYGMQGGVIGGSDLGRWPANVTHDGSEEVLAGFPESDGQQGALRGTEPSETFSSVYSGPKARQPFAPRGDAGSAARFFYCAKAGKEDRAGSKHPTVKPVALMRWLCRLITPPGGLILDPFAGSGTTGQAALEEGFRAVLIEQEPEYLTDIRNRIAGLARATAEAMPLFHQPSPEVA